MFVLLPLFFFNDTATTEIYTLSLHDALPISHRVGHGRDHLGGVRHPHKVDEPHAVAAGDRKSTRLNSSHSSIQYAVVCVKKKVPAAPAPLRQRLRCGHSGCQ